MSWLLPVLMLVVLFACVATCLNEGIWSNAIRLINVVTAALLAMNFFEPIARALDRWDKSYTYIWDFLVLWGLFAVFMLVMRLATDGVSRVKVRFLKIVDRIGSGVLSVWIGWVMVCFTLMTLHTAPLARNFMFEGFETGTENRMMWGLAPDRQMLGFMQKSSLGVFSRMEPRPFDPNADFMPKYATRRSNLEEHVNRTNSLRTN
jgi:hypothetical protein